MIDRWLAARAPTTLLTVQVLTDIHRVIFDRLFPELAGRLRGVELGEINIPVTFGGRHNGTPPAQVRAECEVLVRSLRHYLAQLATFRATMPPGDFAWEVIKVAAYAHCELVRIHPFVNGNGRTSRKIIEYFAWRYGFKPFAPPVRDDRAERDDYLDRIRTHLDRKTSEDFARYLAKYWEADPDAGNFT